MSKEDASIVKQSYLLLWKLANSYLSLLDKFLKLFKWLFKLKLGD
jgi:hypothetical protein